MKNLKTGQFFGQTNQIIRLNGLTLTDTEYTHPKVDWHYHENAYFTFILEGSVIEGNKKEVYHCGPGSLLYHNWQDAHYNIKPEGFTRGFHIELDESWYAKYNLSNNQTEGSIRLKDPRLQILMYNIFKEVKFDDDIRPLSVNSLLINLFGEMAGVQKKTHHKVPGWVNSLKDTLNDAPAENWSLDALSAFLDIHPVHLSRDFNKYFNCNMGEYIRNVKVGRAMGMMSDRKLSLTDIALTCGFADQSHFIRCFKAANQINPSQYRKLLQK